jgi:hypothetical protein
MLGLAVVGAMLLLLTTTVVVALQVLEILTESEDEMTEDRGSPVSASHPCRGYSSKIPYSGMHYRRFSRSIGSGNRISSPSMSVASICQRR